MERPAMAPDIGQEPAWVNRSVFTMKRIAMSVSLGFIFVAAVSAAAQQPFGTGGPASPLSIGDPAPPLSIAEWVRGRPVDLARDAGKRFHVIEFWAVWCPPCKASVPLLTQYQKRYKKDIVIVGVSQPDLRGNTPSAIRRFVDEQGSNMEYTVAIDTGRTTESYLSAAGVVGIPHAFVINKDGKVAWQGSPLDPAIDEVLAGLVAGTYDMEAAKIKEQVTKKMNDLNLLAQLGQWQAVWDGLAEILKIDPANQDAIAALISISAEGLKNAEALCSWVHSHVAENRDNVKAMQRLADALLEIGDLRRRCPDLALKAAKAAYEAGPRPDAPTIAAYARAHYQIGELDRAIMLQQDAVAVAPDDQRDDTKAVLEYYRMCKQLQGTLD
jgi:thiol-disulfide isomerase/thioredoxin